MTKLLKIDLRSTAPQMLGSRGTPSEFVSYGLKNMCTKFDAFTRFVAIFSLTDQTKNKHPDITVINDKNRECQVFDVACPEDSFDQVKEDEKVPVDNSIDLAI